MFWPLLSLWYLGGSFVLLAFVFAGECLISLKFQRVHLPPQWPITITQFAYMKGLETYDALLCVTYTLQSALEMGQEARIVQIDFSAAFDRATYQEIISELCSVGAGGSLPSILMQFFSNRSQYVVVEGYRSKLVNVVS